MDNKPFKSLWDMNEYEFYRWEKDAHFFAECDNFINASMEGGYEDPEQLHQDIVRLFENAEAEAIGSALYYRGMHIRPSRRERRRRANSPPPPRRNRRNRRNVFSFEDQIDQLEALSRYHEEAVSAMVQRRGFNVSPTNDQED